MTYLDIQTLFSTHLFELAAYLWIDFFLLYVM